MYVPKSTDQMWNEIVMANAIIDDAVKKAKICYLNKDYKSAGEHCNLALNTGKTYLTSFNIEAIYIIGRCYQNLGDEKQAKKFLQIAKENGIYMDSQVFK
jgi:hypothetical protein